MDIGWGMRIHRHIETGLRFFLSDKPTPHIETEDECIVCFTRREMLWLDSHKDEFREFPDRFKFVWQQKLEDYTHSPLPEVSTPISHPPKLEIVFSGNASPEVQPYLEEIKRVLGR